MKKRKNPYNISDVMERDNCTEFEAFEKINELKNKTSGSLNSFICRYGKELGLEKYNESCKKSAQTKEKFQEKYSECWEEKWNQYLKTKDSMSLEFHIKKFGEEQGKIEFKKRKQGIIQSKEQMILKYGEVKGIEKFNEMNLKRSFSCSTEGLIQKYGEEETLNINKSKGNFGKNNHQFGKPAPKGSGNSWAGWYNGIHFRSFFELSYMKFLNDSNIEFINAEKKEFKIIYTFKDEERNYFYDFILIDTDERIEIKPKALINTEQNIAKFLSAKKILGDKFKVLTEDDFYILTNKDIDILIENGEVELIEKHKEKFNKQKGNK